MRQLADFDAAAQQLTSDEPCAAYRMDDEENVQNL
jgi:hypothetical protein